MRQLHPTRTSSLLITSLGLLTNTFLTVYLLSSSLSSESSYKWEPESEWESTSTSASWLFGGLGLGNWGGGGEGDGWGAGGLGSKVDGVKLLRGLLIAYFASAACVCGLGVWGVLKTLPAYIRFYRDYTIASISFTTFFLALATYGSFIGHSRASLCESLSQYPELMRSLQEHGILSVELTLENCEGWLEGAVVVGLAGVCLVMAVRLHFLLAVSNYYGYIVRYKTKNGSIALSSSSSSPLHASSSSSAKMHSRSKSHSHSSTTRSPSRPSGSSSSTSSSSGSSRTPSNSTPSAPMQRIYLLPPSLSTLPPSSSGETRMVYAPVPLDSLPLEMQVQAMEAWVRHQPPSSLSSSSSSHSGSERSSDRERLGMGTSHQRHKSHRRRSSSVLTVVQEPREEDDKGAHLKV